MRFNRNQIAQTLKCAWNFVYIVSAPQFCFFVLLCCSLNWVYSFCIVSSVYHYLLLQAFYTSVFFVDRSSNGLCTTKHRNTYFFLVVYVSSQKYGRDAFSFIMRQTGIYERFYMNAFIFYPSREMIFLIGLFGKYMPKPVDCWPVQYKQSMKKCLTGRNANKNRVKRKREMCHSLPCTSCISMLFTNIRIVSNSYSGL